MTRQPSSAETQATRLHRVPSPDGILTRRQRDQLQRRKNRIAASALAVALAAGLGGAAYASGMIPGSKQTSAPKIGRDYTPAVPNVTGNNSVGMRPPVELSSGRSKAESHPRTVTKKTSSKVVRVAIKSAAPTASTTEIAARSKTVSPARSHRTSGDTHTNHHAIETTQATAPQAEPFDEPKIPNNPDEAAASQQALKIWMQQEQAAHPNAGANNPQNTYPSAAGQKPSWCDLPNGFNDPACN